MMKIAILGSTGTIGKTLIRTIKKNKNKIQVVCLSANKNYKLLIRQAKELNAKNLIIKDYLSYKKAIYENKNTNFKIFNNYKISKKFLSLNLTMF